MVRWIMGLYVSLMLVVAIPVGAINIAFEVTNIVVSDATPGGDVVLLGATHTSVLLMQKVTTVSKIATANSNGNVTFDLGTATPYRSVWAVVDCATGSYALGNTAPQTPRFANLRGGLLENAQPQISLDHGSEAGGQWEVFLVRPGGGVWHKAVFDGGGGDGDGQPNGGALLELPAMVSMRSQTPHALQATSSGDTLVIIDPDILTIQVSTVGQ